MAATKLDQLWDGWMMDLGRSYSKTLSLLEQNKPDEALAEYRAGCLASVKKLYSEAASTYPVRFSKAKTWCVWTKKLYVLSVKVEKALRATQTKQARTLLAEMRTHFYLLHEETLTFNCNDWIHAFHMELAKDTPSVAELKKIMTQFDQAKPCLLAQDKNVAHLYDLARDSWLKTVTLILKADELSDEDLTALRDASGPFHKMYGLQFE
ncbi:MAG: hypothetical protein GY809_12450 [Planctomycetes bacterium]|nr:hypothetical protein [Planctomycetota bacterium]